VTMLMVANSKVKKGVEEFGFILSYSRIGAKKKDREKECAKELADALDLLPLDDMKGWCQMPDASQAKREVDPADLERLRTSACERVPKTVIEMPEPAACVVVAAVPWGQESQPSVESELAILEKFDAGFAELLREARRVSGLVRKQWFLAEVMAKPAESTETSRPVILGVGLATDLNLAKTRAVHAARIRVQVLSEAMFVKPAAPKAPPAPAPPAPPATPS